jgi:pimeloyl-ACP methyl ester carboxylesterase
MTPDGFTHHTAPTIAGRIHYVRGGSGPLLLLLHGWPQTWFEWRRVMPELAGHYTVVAADWRGAGFSGRPAAGYDADTIAAELREVVRPLAPDAPIPVIEHDWGAVFAYCYAAQYRDEVAALGIFEMALPGLGHGGDGQRFGGRLGRPSTCRATAGAAQVPWPFSRKPLSPADGSSR